MSLIALVFFIIIGLPAFFVLFAFLSQDSTAVANARLRQSKAHGTPSHPYKF